MDFAIPNLVGFLARPLTLAIIAVVLGLALGRRGRALRWAGSLALLALVVLPVQWALLPLEDRFPRPNQAPGHVDGVIVLGGALEIFVSAERGIPSLNGAAERMTAFVALARRYPEAKLVFSGGYGSLVGGGRQEADIARDLFTSLGLPPDRVLYEGRSRNTWENAIDSYALAQPKPGETWVLVTSASHMPRAVGIFRHVGWPVVAWPVAYKATRALVPSVLASASDKAGALDVAAHEWAGLIAYRLEGRTDALFPAP